MTIDEKLAQLGSAWVFQLASASGFDAARAAPVLADGIGHVTRVCGASGFSAAEAAAFANELQRHLLEHTRLGIPAIVHEEICAGLMAREATVFPQAIGVAATFRPDLNAELADAVRLQMRAIGAHHGLSPVLDLCRDPRWGRLEETYGEDPHLVTQMGLAYIRGLQGDDLTDGVVATAKHFVGYGASEGGFNWAPAHLNERELRDVYLRPFEAAVRVARAGLGDERLSRDRRRAVRRQRMAARRGPARRVGVRRHRRVRLLRGPPARGLPPRRRIGPRGRCPGADVRASTSSCQAPTATRRPCAMP